MQRTQLSPDLLDSDTSRRLPVLIIFPELLSPRRPPLLDTPQQPSDMTATPPPPPPPAVPATVSRVNTLANESTLTARDPSSMSEHSLPPEESGRKQMYPYIAGDLDRHRIFLPHDDFYRVIYDLPPDWNQPGSTFNKKVEALTCDPSYAAFFDRYLQVLPVVSATKEAEPGLETNRQDCNFLYGSNPERAPNLYEVLQEVWMSSTINDGTARFPLQQIVHWTDMNNQDVLDRGAGAHTALTNDGLDPRSGRPPPIMGSNPGGPTRTKNNSGSSRMNPYPPPGERGATKSPLSSSTSSPAVSNAASEPEAQDRRKIAYQCASHAMEVLSHAGMRSHCLGFIVGRQLVQGLYYDRSAIVVSQPFSLKDHPNLFAAINVRMRELTAAERGIMPKPFVDRWFSNLADRPNESKLPPTFAGCRLSVSTGQGKPSVVLTLGEVVSRHAGLIGRNTTTVNVTVSAEGEWGDVPLVAKISFPPRCRHNEAELIDKIRKQAESSGASWVSKCMPRVFAHETIEFDNNHPIARLDEYCGNEAQNWVGDKPYTYVRRVCRVTVMEKLHPIKELPSATAWRKVFLDTVQVHRWIYDKADILHRDISLGNIMYRKIGDDFYGVLNDFDLAAYKTDVSPQRTGTRSFMAIDLHSPTPPRHLYRHDLESFFYVLVWVSFIYRQNENGLCSSPETDVETRLSATRTDDALGDTKSALFLRLKSWKRSMCPDMRDATVALINSFARYFYRAIFDGGLAKTIKLSMVTSCTSDS